MLVVCCVIGHREFQGTESLREQLYQRIEDLIVNKGVDTFLLGSKSRFNSFCYGVITDIKEKYPHIKRVYVRAEYPVIDEDYRRYLLEDYEDTYYPESVINAGWRAYIKRNIEMIDRSQVCLIYFDEADIPKGRKSGTKFAFDYARKHKKEIIHIKSNQQEK